MAIDEKTMNGYIAEAMELQSPRGYQVTAERHGQALEGHTSPDIVVDMPYRLRTIIELEYDAPALGDARDRLGYQFNDHNLPMKSVLAVGIPETWGDLSHADRRQALASDRPELLLQVVTGRSAEDPERKILPEQPVAVSLRDLVQYAWLAAIPEPYAQSVVETVISELQRAKLDLTARLRMAGDFTQAELIRRYGNHDSANGLESVAGNVVGTLSSMIQLHMNLKAWGNQEQLLGLDDPYFWQKIPPYDGIIYRFAQQWRQIEAVDYMPLSTIAAGILEDTDVSAQLPGGLRVIYQAMADYLQAGISVTTNVAAEIWQALIPDRDERAAYYTKPPTAELLANMTTAMLDDPATAKYNEICAGTGTIARATEENLRFRHYARTEDKSSIHAQRMETCIQLTDINPQSVSVATANMAALEPETPFQSSAIFAITAKGGSLNFLSPEGVADMSDQLVGSHGVRGEMLTLIPNTIDICCNNDPYFRARGGAKNPIDRQAMQTYRRQADRNLKGVAHGQAGLATFMHVIEHKMLGYNRPHGKVLPLTAAHSESYTGFRRHIEREYCSVIAISAAAGDGVSMSADTGIQEMLLVARKQPKPKGNGHPENGDRAVTCVNLNRTFATKLEAKMFADAIRREVALGHKSGNIVVGGVVGTYYRMTGLGEGRPWSALGTGGDYTILTAHITDGQAWHPATGRLTDFALPMTTLSGVSDKGPTHDLLGSLPESRAPRGAFTMHPEETAESRENPSLWIVDAETQVKITCSPTHYGAPGADAEEAERMLATAGHFHLSRNLRMSAQKIAMAYTEMECLGGRSWTTIKAIGETGTAEALALFLNSTYGMLIRVGYGQSTDPGRSTIQVRAIDGHPVPDFAADSPAGQQARQIARDNFARLRQLELDRISLSVLDPNRAEIDRVVTLMLGLPYNPATERMLQSWRRLMCLQPGVNARNKETLEKLAAAGIR